MGERVLNVGLYERYTITGEAQDFEVQGRIVRELFYLNQFLLPEVPVRIKLFKKNPSFRLHSPEKKPDNTIFSRDVKLHAQYVKVKQKFHEKVQRHLATRPAVYTIYNAIVVNSRQLVAGSRKYVLVNFFDPDRLPNCVVFAMVSHSAYPGDYKANPLNFHHYNLSEISLKIDYQVMTYKLDASRRIYVPLYFASACQWSSKDFECSTNIKYETILGGTAIFPFDLTPNHSTEDIQMTRLQSARLKFIFSTTLTEPVELLVFSEQPKVFHVDKERKFIAVM